MRKSLLLALGVLAGGCTRGAGPRSMPPPEPRDARSSALGIAVSLRDARGTVTVPEVVYFARLQPGATPEQALMQPSLVPSNHAEDGRYYLFNAPPGIYAVVAAAEKRPVEGLAGRVSGESTRREDETSTGIAIDVGKRKLRLHRVYFARDLAQATRTSLAPGTFAYAGTIVVDTGPFAADADSVQLHYRRVLEGDPGLQLGDPVTAPQALAGRVAHVRRDAGAAAAFWAGAEAALGKSAWPAHPRTP